MATRRPQPLDEDLYVEALSEIIQRDFYPDLDRLRAESTFLDALASRDAYRIHHARQRLDAMDAAAASSANDDAESVHHSAGIDTRLPLDAFLARYTSEDNAAFHALLEQERKEVRRKLKWMFDAEERAKNERALLLEAEPSGSAGAAIAGQRAIEDAPRQDGEQMALVPVSSSSTALLTIADAPRPDPREDQLHRLLPNKDERRAVVPTWEYTAHNQLMFPPSESTTAALLKRRKTGSDAQTNYAATRFHGPSPLAQLTQAASAAGASTTPTAPAIPSTPYSLVSMTPIPHGATADMPPDLTWGAIEATPMAVRDDNESVVSVSTTVTDRVPGRYHVPDTPKRDALGIALSDRARKRGSSRASGVTGTPRWTPGSASVAGKGWSVHTAGSVMTPFSFTPKGVATPKEAAARPVVAVYHRGAMVPSIQSHSTVSCALSGKLSVDISQHPVWFDEIPATAGRPPLPTATMLATTAATTARHWAQRARQAATHPLAPRTEQKRHVAKFSFERLQDAVAKRMAAPVVMNFDFNDDPAPPDAAANAADPAPVAPITVAPPSARPPRLPSSSPRTDRTKRSAPRARRRLVDELSASWWQEQTGSSSSSPPSVPSATTFFSSPTPFFSSSSSSPSSQPASALPRLDDVLAPAPAPDLVVVRHLAPRGTRMLLAAHGAVRHGQVDKAIEALDRIPWSNLRIPIDMTRAILDETRPIDSDAVALRLLLREIARKSTMLDDLAVAEAVVRGVLQVPAWDVLVKVDPVAFLLWPTMALKHVSLDHYKHDLQTVADRRLPQLDYSDESLRLQWTITALGLARVHAKSKNEAAMQRLFYGVLGPNDIPIPAPCVPLFTEFARLLVDTIATDRPTFDSPVILDSAAAAHPPPATTSDRLLPVFAVLQRYKMDADTHVNATILRALLGDRGALAGFDFLMSVLRAHPVGKTPVMAAHVAVTVDRLVRGRYTSEAAQLVDAALPSNHGNWNAPGWHAWMLSTLAAGHAQAVVDRAGPALEGIRAKHRTAYLHETVFRALEQLGRADEALAVHASTVSLKHKLTIPYYMTVIRLATTPARIAADPDATAVACVAYLDEMASKRLAPNDWILAHLSRVAADLGDAGFPLATRVAHTTPALSESSFEGESAAAQFASAVAPLLHESVAPGMTTNDTHARIVRARRMLDAISVQYGPDALDLTAWAQYLHAVTDAFRTAAPVVRAEMVRATHVRVVDAYKEAGMRHDGYLAVLVDALARAEVPEVACALWDQVVLGGPADPGMVRDGWTVLTTGATLEPSGWLVSAMADLLGFHGRVERLHALEEFVEGLPDSAAAKRDPNVWTSLVEAYFRLGEPESARRVIVDRIPGLKVPVGTKLKATVAGMANRPGAKAQWVVMDPEVRRVLQFKMDVRSLSL
ncbi:hypothetical protein GGF32_000936 [Allomyces javanicus]|nr:hypothetical protein GGF32_000936 [Allomyces javanicus]